MDKQQITKVAVGAVIVGVAAFLLYRLSNNSIEFPSLSQIKQNGAPLIILLILSIVISFLILYIVFEPKTPQSIAAVAGASLLWAIF